MLEPTTVVDARVGKGSISAQQLAEHEGLVHWLVRQQWLGELSFADALHAGRLGLWRALRSYDPARGTMLSTYAVPAIARAVWRAVREHQSLASVGDEPLATATVEIVDLGDMAEAVYRAEVRAELHRLVGTLPQRLRQVVIAHYGLGKGEGEPQTFAAIGSALGVTRQRVQQLHAEAMLWLAHPAHSLALRRILERNRRLDYQQFASRQRLRARSVRGRSARRRVEK